MATNPILDRLNSNKTNEQSSGPFDGLKQVLAALRSSRNPQQMVSNMLSQNPDAQQFVNQVSRSGGSFKDAFYAAAKAKGVDPDQIINMLK